MPTAPVKLKEEFVAMLRDMNAPCFEGLPETLAGTEPSVALRFNRRFGIPAELTREVPWCSRGRYLDSRPSFTRDPAMHQGVYYVQDASSMFVAHVLSQLVATIGRPVKMLDACAAPGGKTTAAIDVLPESSVLVANEFVPARAAVLKENIIKHGNENVIVTNDDAYNLRRLRDTFDIVLVDAPCSGEGMMRKDPQAVAQWNRNLIYECVQLQNSITGSAWQALKPGGYLIYSTCTFNRLENERLIESFVNYPGAEPVEIAIDEKWGICRGIDTAIPCYRFIPGRVEGEGLFMAVLRKPGTLTDRVKESAESKHAKKSALVVPDNVKNRILHPENFTLTERDGVITAFPSAHKELLRQVEKNAKVIHAGIKLGENTGKDFAPTQSLALSRCLNPDAFPRVDIGLADALEYLRRQAITLPAETPRGYVLLTYAGNPLGFVKNLGNRANNLYPKEWRILSSY